MPKYRKKPVVIDATQWFKNGDHPLDYDKDIVDPVSGNTYTADRRKNENWEGDVVRYFRHPDPDKAGDQTCGYCGKTYHEHGWIDTMEGGHIVCPGDWIITGVSGENYPCKPDIFEKTYEAVQE